MTIRRCHAAMGAILLISIHRMLLNWRHEVPSPGAPGAAAGGIACLGEGHVAPSKVSNCREP